MNKPPFKIGDKVKCVDLRSSGETTRLVLNEIYTINSIREDYCIENSWWISITGPGYEKPNKTEFFHWRFELTPNFKELVNNNDINSLSRMIADAISKDV